MERDSTELDSFRWSTDKRGTESPQVEVADSESANNCFRWSYAEDTTKTAD